MPRAGWNPALEQLVRAVPGAGRIMIEARVETGADLRRRLDQWQALDAPVPGALELLSDGGVRLKASTATGPGSNTITASARSKQDVGATEPFIDPVVPDGTNRLAALVAWGGTESAQLDLTQLLVNLHPQFNLALPKTVARWRLDMYRVARVDFDIFGHGTLFVQPLVIGLEVPAPGHAAGLVLFDFTSQSSRPRPKQVKTDGNPSPALGFVKDRPHTLVLIRAIDATGKAARNIGWGYNAGASTQVSAAGSTLSGQRIRGKTGNQYQLVGPSNSVPAIQFILATHPTPATSGFTGPTNQITLPAATPTAQIELVGRADVPPGTTVLYEVQDDAAVWRAYQDSQTLDLLAGFAGPTYTTLKQRFTLTPNAAGDRSAILRELGARAVTTQDLSNVCEVQSLQYLCDPQDLHCEIPDLVLRAIHDGERDFRDAITQLLSQNPLGSLSLRLWVGHPALPKRQWCHLDDFPVFEDYDLFASHVLCQLQSPLVLVKSVLPRATSEIDAYPTADVANPGAWTQSAATTTFAELLADNQGGIGYLPWDDTTYVQAPANPGTAGKSLTLQLGAIGAPDTLAGVQVQFRYGAAVAQGAVHLEVTLFSAGLAVAQTLVLVSGTAIVQGTLALTGTQIAAVRDWANCTLQFRAFTFDLITGTVPSARVTWARLAVLPKRAALVYAFPRAVGDVTRDLLANQVGLDARYLGPGIVDVAGPTGGIDLAQSVTVGKTITARPGGATDLQEALQELAALGDLAGGAWTSEQGRVVFKPFFDVAVDPATGAVTYTPKTPAPAAVIPSTELEPVGVTPGFKYRVPLFDAWGGYDDAKGFYQLEAHGTLPAPLLSSVGPAWLVARRQLDDRSARWIQSQGLLNGRVLRQIQTLGLGQLAWRFRTTYPRPELTISDVIAIETDRFLAYDPTAARALAGLQWVLGFVVGIHNVWGTELTIWLPSFASVGAFAQPASQPPAPPLSAVTIAVTVVPRAGGMLQVSWAGQPAVQSVRIGFTTASAAAGPILASPLDETGRLTTAQGATPQGSAFLGSLAPPFGQADRPGQAQPMDGSALSGAPPRLLGAASGGQPPAGAGNVYLGQTGAALIGRFAFGDVVFLTVTPYATPDGSGPPGPAQQLQVRLDVEADQNDPIVGRRFREALLHDGSAIVRALSVIAADAGWTQANARPGTHTQQLLPNFGFEDGLVFWAGAGGAHRIVTAAANAHSGNRYLESTSTTGVRAEAAATDDAGQQRFFEVTPGDVVQWGGWAYRESGTANVSFELVTQDKDKGGSVAYFTPNQNTAAWVYVQGQLVIPAGVKYVRFFTSVDDVGTGTVARFDDAFLRIAFGASTILNGQGSTLPTPVTALPLSYASSTNSGVLRWTWAAFTLYRPDRGTIAVPASASMPVPGAPVLSSQAGGAIGATTYGVRIAYVKNGHLCGISAFNTQAVAANNLLVVTSPAAVGGYDGWIPLLNSNGLNDAGCVPRDIQPPSSPIPFGTNFVEPTTGIGASIGGPVGYEATWNTAIVALQLANSTTYTEYPYWDVVNSVLAMAGAAGSTSNAAYAQEQHADGHVAIGDAPITGITAGAGAPSGGQGGGGNGGRFL